MAYPAFTLLGSAFLSVATTSARVALPTAGTPTVVLVTNLGEQAALVALGDNTIVASATNAVAVPGGKSLPLIIGSATNIAGITISGATGLNIAVGS